MRNIGLKHHRPNVLGLKFLDFSQKNAAVSQIVLNGISNFSLSSYDWLNFQLSIRVLHVTPQMETVN